MEGTLIEITHNMGQMTDLMAKIYTKFEDDALRPTGHNSHQHKRARVDSQPADSELSDSQEECRSKRRKSSRPRAEQDSLSIYAGDDVEDSDRDIDNFSSSTQIRSTTRQKLTRTISFGILLKRLRMKMPPAMTLSSN